VPDLDAFGFNLRSPDTATTLVEGVTKSTRRGDRAATATAVVTVGTMDFSGTLLSCHGALSGLGVQRDLVASKVGNRLDDVNLGIEVAVEPIIMEKPAIVTVSGQESGSVLPRRQDLQGRSHAACINWKMREVCDENAVVDGIMALQTYALATSLRLHVDDGVIVDSEVDLVANDSSETHRCSLIFGDVAGTSTSVLVVSVDEVEGAEEVASIQLLVELVRVGYAEHGKSAEALIEQHRSR
jgi:hypothetical protein